MTDKEAFEAAWPAIHKHGISGGWEAVAWAAWQEAVRLEREADPLQGAANWLAQAHGQFCPTVLQACLMIGYNRAKRLYDAAIRSKGGKG